MKESGGVTDGSEMASSSRQSVNFCLSELDLVHLFTLLHFNLIELLGSFTFYII